MWLSRDTSFNVHGFVVKLRRTGKNARDSTDVHSGIIDSENGYNFVTKALGPQTDGK